MFAGLKPNRTRLGLTRLCCSPEANTWTQPVPCTTVLTRGVGQTHTGQYPDISYKHEGKCCCMYRCTFIGPTKYWKMYSWIITFVISCVHMGICNFQCITPPVFSFLYVCQVRSPNDGNKLGSSQLSPLSTLPVLRVLFRCNLFDVSSVFWLFFQANLIIILILIDPV